MSTHRTPEVPNPPRPPQAPKTLPQETPEVEGSTAAAHPERPDGGLWEHPAVFLTLIAIGSVMVAAFFLVRVMGW